MKVITIKDPKGTTTIAVEDPRTDWKQSLSSTTPQTGKSS